MRGEAEMRESEWKSVWRSGFWGEVTTGVEEGGRAGERKHRRDLWQPVNIAASRTSQHPICSLCQFLQKSKSSFVSLKTFSSLLLFFIFFLCNMRVSLSMSYECSLEYKIKAFKTTFVLFVNLLSLSVFIHTVFSRFSSPSKMMSLQSVQRQERTHMHAQFPATPTALYSVVLDWPEYLRHDFHQS